jgi:hypothetical protein
MFFKIRGLVLEPVCNRRTEFCIVPRQFDFPWGETSSRTAKRPLPLERQKNRHLPVVSVLIFILRHVVE